MFHQSSMGIGVVFKSRNIPHNEMHLNISVKNQIQFPTYNKVRIIIVGGLVRYKRKHSVILEINLFYIFYFKR